MQKKQATYIASLVSWFAEKYNKLKEQRRLNTDTAHIFVKYKIGSDYESYLKSGKILLRSRTGPIYCNLTPQEIYEDPHIVKAMHPIDALAIAKLFLEKTLPKNQNELKITKEFSDPVSGKLKYILTSTHLDETYTLFAEELFEKYDLIERLSAKDSLSIGFKMGNDYFDKISKDLRS